MTTQVAAISTPVRAAGTAANDRFNEIVRACQPTPRRSTKTVVA